MNRRSFFKFLGIGAATAVVAPKVLEASEPKPTNHKETWIGTDLLITYEESCKGNDYSIGVYTGYGLNNSDPSCVSVVRKGKGNEPDVQVAEYVSSKISPYELADKVAYIANIYKKWCVDPRGPIIVIEQMICPGDLVQEQLKIMGFTRFYEMKTTKNPPRTRSGWYSTSYSKPIIISRFNDAVDTGWYKPKSARLVESMALQNTDSPYFMAAAQAYMGAHMEDKI